ncbi:MAG TPA: type II toxin-antitoxin system PemK/MazF family toxin [Dehalococcoidales bacterium]|nr:type II toxin-antitoxin system PemK/MazF family toxin [Dehalococcoidales bacterium]
MPAIKSRDLPAFPLYGDVFDVLMENGGKPAPHRRAVIVSNNLNNEFSSTVTILPVMGNNEGKIYSFEVFVPKGVAGLNKDSRIQADQVRTIDKKRLVTFHGALPDDILKQVEKAIKVHLNMKVY